MKIKAIFMDFDGVILDSADIKTEAFREIFMEKIPEKIGEIVDYWEYNGGISRRIKFAHVYSKYLNHELSEKELDDLSDRFTSMTLEKIMSAPIVDGLTRFLEKAGVPIIIASGGPTEQLKEILKHRKLDGFFSKVEGSPAKKSATINETIRDLGIKRDDVIFIGDTMTDYNEAMKAGVYFIGIIKEKNPFPEGVRTFRDFHALTSALEAEGMI